VKTYVYPAYFRCVGGTAYSVDFPDLPGCVSAGATPEEALTMAREALSLHLYGLAEDGRALPAATGLAGLAAEPAAFLGLVEGRPDIVKAELRNRSVKKTLTIPYWLNVEAERLGVNFSQLLQDSLRERLGL
jgi:predicted RNase H-like HicB family nuclease